MDPAVPNTSAGHFSRSESPPLKKPALKLTGTQRPVVAIPERRTAPVLLPQQVAAAPVDPPEPVAGETQPVARPAAVSAWPSGDSLDAWVDAGDEFSIRFSHTDGKTRGNVAAGDWEYFRTDHASAMEWAGLIGEALGFSPPALAAIVEPDRAACYRQLSGGFAGAYSGPGCTVDQLVGIP